MHSKSKVCHGVVVGIAALLAMASNSCLKAQAASHPDDDSKVVLLELFTSEGCSSCPPADELLRKLDGQQTNSGQRMIALSEHVTYWNQLGWSDRFSQQAFTDRQNSYGNRFQLDSVYTPQLVVNGNRQVLGSDGRAILRAVAEQEAATVNLRVLTFRPNEHGWNLEFSVAGTVPKEGVAIFAVIADDQDSTHVQRGENEGRTLTHVSVARSLTRVASVQSAGTMTVKVDGGAIGQSAGTQHLVLFAQERGSGHVLGVTASPIPLRKP